MIYSIRVVAGYSPIRSPKDKRDQFVTFLVGVWADSSTDSLTFLAHKTGAINFIQLHY